jgi:Lhr-like helicase
MNSKTYSIENVFLGLTQSLYQYLEAQYHIRDEAILGERKRLLETAGVTYQVPRLEATPFYALGKPYRDMLIPSAAREVLDAASKLNIGIYQSPFLHQARAIEAFLGENSQDIIVATGTGSGKTESFLMPILGSLALEPEISMQSAKLPGCRAILLYPMNALVNDQLSRLRRLLGNADLAALLSKKRERLIRFGMYTGRTPYPGNASSEKDGERLSPLFDKLFNNISEEIRVLLESEGKWPAKNMHQFAARAFATGEEDRELYTRHEMQKHCPDLLVTNYSMLEYMLLRPIESSIFDQTTTWLHSDRRNSLIVVLDEAHMYRGAAGAEVAMLLRRLQSRLQVDRSQLRYILTSASLGSSEEASNAVIKFAADLTGLESGKSFQLITGELEEIEVFAVATVNEIQALSSVNVEDIHACATDFRRTQFAINEFMRNLGHPLLQCENEAKLKDEIFGFLRKFGPAGLLSKTITGHPETFDHIAEKIFQDSNQANKALESLVAICNFARRRKDDRVFLPVRMHVMFRGLSGIFACSNPECSYKVKIKGSTYLGRLFDSPRLHCECGARVYELLTHRDCGAAFLRGFMRNENDDFLWHESTKLPRPGNNQLLEAHFLVEVDRDRAQSADHIWLHISTGKISRSCPSNLNGYLPLIQPQSIFDAHGNRIVTFDRECPVCLRTWRDETKIMDLATKGEAPFAHLVKTQVRLQPPTKERSFRFPNQGRKCLLFSDGRQKAARLARDIPREVERDVFRQAIILAVRDLQNRVHGGEARLDPLFLYSAFLNIVSRFSLNLFDGKDSDALKRNAEEFKRDFSNDLALAIENYFNRQPPLQYSAHLLRLLGNPFYSVHALTIAHVVPTRIAHDVLSKSGLGLSEIELKVLASVWIQSLLDRFALDDMLGDGVRVSAAGYGSNSWGENRGISGRRRKVITSILGDFANAEQVFETHLATRKNGFLFLKPDKLKLELALNKEWFQCQDCTYVTIGVLRGQCVNCGSHSVNPVNPETSDYLRARKTFWRDPIVAMLEGKEEPFHLDVQEHTAQLSYRDTDDPTSTTEEYERRFRDILVHENDTPIDVLSSTTTMEVGIDIGSLVAVGLRNVPPMRQNYQQRAGRAGRRGSAVSTVITYAQNSPHDHYYFSNPEKIIAGEPPLPSIDIRNPRIIKRHVHAVLLQTYFHEQIENLVSSSNIFSVLGDTWDFYNSNGPFSIRAFNEWINNGESENIYLQIQKWMPGKVVLDSKSIAGSFVNELESLRPTTKEQLIGQLLTPVEN